ncbi:hypothetical protein [Keratinibaculum paraultunense]|nr:hypothetical protein [Keratinibaculum paraultunense]QQY79228.1 hypothetical protein JL105_08520 [Keratinibaculum paraultunense]
MNGHKNIKNSHIKLFTILLTAIWLISGIYYGFKYDLKIGISVIIFGLAFLVVFKLVQQYSLKMLREYDENLNNRGGK